MKNKVNNHVTRQFVLFEIHPPKIVRHEYDIDVFEIFDELKKKYLLKENIAFAKKNKMFSRIRNDEKIFVKMMKQSGINLSINKKTRHYILPSTNSFYNIYLGWKILAIDPYKIEALLSYQSVLFLGNVNTPKEDFLGLVEFHVYEFVKYRNHFNENIRLEKIMNWVERNRVFILNKNNPDAINIPPPKFRIITFENIEFANILYQKLRPFFIKDNHNNLFRLIVNGENVSGLCFNGKAISLVELFKRLRYRKKIFIDSNIILRDWLCNSFKVLNKEKKVESLNKDTVLEILNKEGKEPAKINRILEDIAEYLLKSDRKDIKEEIKK